MAWLGYMLATVIFLFGLAFLPLFLIIGGLFITSYMMVRGNPAGPILQAVLVVILFLISYEAVRSDPSTSKTPYLTR